MTTSIKMCEINNDVAKCIMILRSAKNDNEKLAGMFMVTKAVDEKNCNTASRTALFKAIGSDFFTKLLTSTDVPNDCSPFVYKSLAVTVLGCFCHDPELASHPDMLVHIPSILSLFKTFVEMSDECNFQDCYTLLQLIASNEKGQDHLITNKAIHELGLMYTHQSFKEIELLRLFIFLLTQDRFFLKNDCHLVHKVLNKLSEKFKTEQTQLKFQIIPHLLSLLSVCNNFYIVIDNSTKHPWPQNIFLGVRDILSSKINKSQRDPALRLVSMVIDMLGIKWTMRDENEPKKYFLLFVHLSAIEVRMQMEERTFKEVMKEVEVLVSCFVVLEAAIYFMASDELILQQNDILTVYTSLKNAFNAVLEVLTEVSQHYKETLNEAEKKFIEAIVKVLIAWLTQETTSPQLQIYNVLPFMLQVANETFHQSRFDENQGDLLRLMLPVLCHYIVDDKGREIIVATEADTLCECIFYHWQRFYSNSRKIPFGREKNLPMVQSRSAIIYLCDIFSNIALLDSSQSLNNYTFKSLFEFIILNVSDINNSDINISIDGSLAVLGLIILKQLPDKLVNKFEAHRLLNIVFSFLSNAYQIDDDAKTIALNLRILDALEDEWPHVMDFWYLGFETLSSLFTVNSWVMTIAMENAWPEKILQIFARVRPQYFPSNIKRTFENFLCSLVTDNDDNISTLKKYNVINICKDHNLSELKMKINK